MTQWSFVCAIFPVVLKGGVDRPVSVQRRQGEPGTAGYTARRASVSLKPGSLEAWKPEAQERERERPHRRSRQNGWV